MRTVYWVDGHLCIRDLGCTTIAAHINIVKEKMFDKDQVVVSKEL